MQKQASMLLFIAIMMGMIIDGDTSIANSLHGENVEPKRTTITKDVLDKAADVTTNSSFEAEIVTTVDQDKIGSKQLEVAENLVLQYCVATLSVNVTMCIRDLSEDYIAICGLKGVYAHSQFFYAILSSKRCPRFTNYMKDMIEQNKMKNTIQMRKLERKKKKPRRKSKKRKAKKRKNRVVCGRKLYNHTTHLCCGAKLLIKNRKSDNCCHKTIYNSNTHRCCGGKVEKTVKYMNCCGRKLFNTTTDMCVRQEIFQRKGFCKTIRSLRHGHTFTIDFHECCHNQLMDVRSHICCNGVIWPTLGNICTCCGKFLYNQTTHFCRCKNVFRKEVNIQIGDYTTRHMMNINTTQSEKTTILPRTNCTVYLSTNAKEAEIRDEYGGDGINKKEKVKSSDLKSNSRQMAFVIIGCCFGSVLALLMVMSLVMCLKRAKSLSTEAFVSCGNVGNVENLAYHNGSGKDISSSVGNTDTRLQSKQCYKYSNQMAVPVLSYNNEALGSFTTNSKVVIPVEEKSNIQTLPFEAVNKIDSAEIVKEVPAPPEEDMKVCSTSLLGHAVTKFPKTPSTAFSEPTFQSKKNQQVYWSNKINTNESDGNSGSSLFTSELTLNLSQFQSDIMISENEDEELVGVEINFLNDISKTTNVKDTNLTKNLVKDVETQTVPFKESNRLDSFGKPFDYNSVLSKDQRTVQLPCSEVKMTLPLEDLGKIECFASTHRDIGAIERKLHLQNSANIVSPALEYCLQGVPYLKNYAIIKMPIVGTIDTNLHAWRVVSDEGEKEISEKIEMPIVKKMDNNLDTFCILSHTQRCGYIYTKVFSWYVFTCDGQTQPRKMLVNAWLYGKLKKHAVNELTAEVYLYLLDIRYNLQDYNQVITSRTKKSGHKLLTNVQPLRFNDEEGKLIDMPLNVECCDKLMLKLNNARPWRFMIDETEPDFDPSKQFVKLQDIVASQATPYPYCCVWKMENEKDTSPSLLKAFVYVTFQSTKATQAPPPQRLEVLTSFGDQESDGRKEAIAREIYDSISTLNGDEVEKLKQRLIGEADITSTCLEDILVKLQMKLDTDKYRQPVRPELDKQPPCSFDERGKLPLRNISDQSQLSGSSESFEDSFKSKEDDNMGNNRDMPHGELSRSPQCSYNTASNQSNNDMNFSGNERDKSSSIPSTHMSVHDSEEGMNACREIFSHSNTYPRQTKQTYDTNSGNKNDKKVVKSSKSENAIDFESPVYFPPRLGALKSEEREDTTDDKNEPNDVRVKRSENKIKTEEAKTDCHIALKEDDCQYDPSL